MNRVLQLLKRLIVAGAPTTDEEQAPPTGSPAHRDSQPILSPVQQLAEDTAPEVSEHLRTFRHLVGISTDPSLSTAHPASHFRPGKRPAPNLGVYARIVRSEMRAKAGYKYYSIAINGCLGGQVVVASALTAMGAAGTSHAAITAFGAINTIIAGFLTYLKGSGLPSRLKYYQNEWKKLREYIEQRERDLSQPSGASLDIYAIVSIIERMYDETKADIEVNTPDGYFSINNVKGHGTLDKMPVPRHSARGVGSGLGPTTQEHSVDLLRTTSSSVGSQSKGPETKLPEKLHHAEYESQEATQDVEKGQ